MRRSVLVLAIAAAGLLVAILSLPLLIDADRFRPAIESELSKSLGRQVKIDNLKFSILSGAVTATGLSIADDPSFSQSPFLTTKSLKLSISLWDAFFSRRLSVHGIAIDSPAAVLIQVPSGTWNFSSLGSKAAGSPAAGPSNGGLALSVKSLKIKGARLSLTRGAGKPETLDHVSIEVNDFDPGAVFPFSLSAEIAGGGNISLNGKAGPIDRQDAANTPLTASLKIANLNLAASGAVPVSSGLDGIVMLDGSASSNGKTLGITGNLKAAKLKLAPGATAAPSPLIFDFALTEDLKTHSGQVTRGNAAIGGVKASFTGAWTQDGESPVLNMLLSAPSVPVTGLAALLPTMDVVLPAGSTPEGGTASAKMMVSGPISGLLISGPVSVQNARLKSFDLGKRMSVIEALAGIKSGPDTEIQRLSANIRMTPAGTSLEKIDIVVPAMGRITGSGTIGPAHTIDFRMRAAVRSGALVSALAPANISFSIGGTSSDPQFRPDVGQLATQEIDRGFKGVKVGGDAGKAADTVLNSLFGKKKAK